MSRYHPGTMGIKARKTNAYGTFHYPKQDAQEVAMLTADTGWKSPGLAFVVDKHLVMAFDEAVMLTFLFPNRKVHHQTVP